MRYIKLFENYNDEGDIEDILTDYYHDDKCELIKNNYYKIYKFKNLDYYNEAIKELDRHNLEYKKALINLGEIGYIITNLSQEVINFLDEKLLSLKTVENDKYVYYLNNIDDKKTKTYYDLKNHVFFIDYDKIWSVFGFKFNSNYYDTQAITTWYAVTNLQKECNHICCSYFTSDNRAVTNLQKECNHISILSLRKLN